MSEKEIQESTKPLTLKGLMPESVAKINAKKVELMTADPQRGAVSNTEAVDRLLLGDEFYEANKKS